MTVEELIDELKQYDPDWLVVCDSNSDFTVKADEDNEEILLEIQG